MNNINERKLEEVNLIEPDNIKQGKIKDTLGDGTNVNYDVKTKGKLQIDGKNVNFDTDLNSETVKEDNLALLEIFDKGVNNIILNLKAKFGNNNSEVNKVISSISSLFDIIDVELDKNLRIKKHNNEDYDGDVISSKTPEGTYNSNIQSKHKSESEMSTGFQQINQPDFKLKNLDEKQDIYIPVSNADPIDLNSDTDRTKLTTRLNNCQALELFHLRLFENFMKTGAFTLTLYEKYKYITSVMLYLLKNLVNKPKLDKLCNKNELKVTTPKIYLPKSVIKNISTLVEEQNKIQDTITHIDTNLKNTNLENMKNMASSEIKTNLLNSDTPSNPSNTNTITTQNTTIVTPKLPTESNA